MLERGGFTSALLARLPMFQRVPRPQLADLARGALAVQAAAGQAVARRGECLPGLMIVRYGLVKLSLRGDVERVLRLVGAGETFGEAALFLGERLPVDATAIADSALLVVPAAPLLALFDSDPGFARGLTASLCHRLQMLVADFEAATLHGARERLAAYLCSLGEEHRVPAGAEERDRLAPGHDQGNALPPAARVHGRRADRGGPARRQAARPRPSFGRRASFSIVCSVIEPKVARAVSSISASTWSTARSTSRAAPPRAAPRSSRTARSRRAA